MMMMMRSMVVLLEKKILNCCPYYHPYCSSADTNNNNHDSTGDTSLLTSQDDDEVEEVKQQINRLIPRLCAASSSSNHLKQAINLISTAILTTPKPPPQPQPQVLTTTWLPVLIDRLALEPDLTLPMYFLNALKYSSSSSSSNNDDDDDDDAGIQSSILTHFAVMLVTCFFQKGHPKKALKIFHWVSRPDFPQIGKDSDLGKLYALLVDGFCRNGMMLDALRVLRVMAAEAANNNKENLLRVFKPCIYRGLLREARIKEAVDLNVALLHGNGPNGTNGKVEDVVELLDRIIAEWVVEYEEIPNHFYLNAHPIQSRKEK